MNLGLLPMWPRFPCDLPKDTTLVLRSHHDNTYTHFRFLYPGQGELSHTLKHTLSSSGLTGLLQYFATKLGFGLKVWYEIFKQCKLR